MPDRSLRVLVADDEPMIARALQRMFEKRGHEVETAGSADEGRPLMSAGAFDAILVDRNMPGDGLTLLRHALEGGFDGFAVLMTGGLDEGEVRDLPGTVHRLQKPFRFGEVVDLVESSCS